MKQGFNSDNLPSVMGDVISEECSFPEKKASTAIALVIILTIISISSRYKILEVFFQILKLQDILKSCSFVLSLKTELAHVAFDPRIDASGIDYQ